jgi:hypothetical protein
LLQPGGHVHPFAVDVALVVNNVAEIHPNAEQHPPVFGRLPVPVGHRSLDRNGALDGPNDARKLAQEAIARQVDDFSAILPAHWQYDGLVRLEIRYGHGLVPAHETRIARDVGHQNGDESSILQIEQPGLFGSGCSLNL